MEGTEGGDERSEGGEEEEEGQIIDTQPRDSERWLDILETSPSEDTNSHSDND
jgi:hypothetical protein